MNTKKIVSTFLAATLMVAGAALAEPKLGFVNIGEIMEKSPQAGAARSSLEKEFATRDKGLTAARDVVLKLEEKLNNDGSIMSESNRVKLEREVLSQKRDYNRMRDEMREDFNIRRNEELGVLQKKVYEVIQQIATKEAYDLVLTQPVLYASPSIDITAKVLEKLSSQ